MQVRVAQKNTCREDTMTLCAIRISRTAAFFCATLLMAAGITRQACAADKVQVGKAIGSALNFTILDVGAAKGIFGKYGTDPTITTFAGDAKLQQALLSGSIDLGIGSGPAMAFSVKGAPVIAVAQLIDAPGSLGVIVTPQSPITKAQDLKGKLLSISTKGSLTEWLVRKLSASLGWGPNGIRTVALGNSAGQIAALRTGQIDGIMGSVQAGDTLAEKHEGRVVLSMDRYVKHFVSNVIFARKALVAEDPKLVDRFLKGFFASMAYFRTHKEQSVAIGAKVVHSSLAVASLAYDTQTKLMVPDGEFDPQGLKLLKESFVSLHILPDEPADAQILTRQFLPVKF
jgi:ABC-type nitrate/sulfonate/bicarbonate transport system substrate-binding protein